MQAKGFTLLEVLVAVALTAIMGVIAYGFLNSAIDAQRGYSLSAKRLDEVNLFFSLLSRDLLHVVNREITNEYGEKEAPLAGGLHSQYVLTLSRSGYPNPRNLPRSELQRIAYGLNDTSIERVAWQALDRVDSEDAYKAIALEGVERFEIRFIRSSDVIVDRDDVAKDWLNAWGAMGQLANSEVPSGLPAAIEVLVELQNFGEVRRLFSLEGAS